MCTGQIRNTKELKKLLLRNTLPVLLIAQRVQMTRIILMNNCIQLRLYPCPELIQWKTRPQEKLHRLVKISPSGLPETKGNEGSGELVQDWQVSLRFLAATVGTQHRLHHCHKVQPQNKVGLFPEHHQTRSMEINSRLGSMSRQPHHQLALSMRRKLGRKSLRSSLARVQPRLELESHHLHLLH